jgi:hypothetical protein
MENKIDERIDQMEMFFTNSSSVHKNRTTEVKTFFSFSDAMNEMQNKHGFIIGRMKNSYDQFLIHMTSEFEPSAQQMQEIKTMTTN